MCVCVLHVHYVLSCLLHRIQFPDPQSHYRSNQVVVNGTVDAVFVARKELVGCLPVVLMFDVHESDKDVLSSSEAAIYYISSIY